MRNAIALVLVTLLASCGGKKTPVEAPAEPAAASITAEMPDTPEARHFAESLVATKISDWVVLSGSGGVILYKSLTFAPDGIWSADGTLRIGEEDAPCQERGTWRIDEATTSETATMDWVITKTTCAAREVGASQRVQMTIFKNGETKIVFR